VLVTTPVASGNTPVRTAASSPAAMTASINDVPRRVSQRCRTMPILQARRAPSARRRLQRESDGERDETTQNW
jgi:hypothetical protein